MRRIIAMRKRFPAFGHGDFRMLFPSNNKVLAFTRTYETQTILVVINLARFTQAVELDLQPWVGWTPEYAFRHVPIPVRDSSPPTVAAPTQPRSAEHTSEPHSHSDLVGRLLLE